MYPGTYSTVTLPKVKSIVSLHK